MVKNRYYLSAVVGLGILLSSCPLNRPRGDDLLAELVEADNNGNRDGVTTIDELIAYCDTKLSRLGDRCERYEHFFTEGGRRRTFRVDASYVRDRKQSTYLGSGGGTDGGK